MFTIYKNGEYFNRIVATEEFAAYLCEALSADGQTYTYEEYNYPEPAEAPEDEPSEDDDTDVLNALLGVSE